MPVTASVLYDLVQCPRRVVLDAFGDQAQADEINPFVRLLWERGTLFERETVAKLNQPFTDLSRTSGSDREQLTRFLYFLGEALRESAVLSTAKSSSFAPALSSGNATAIDQGVAPRHRLERLGRT
jgi:hypothetical protein